jgi:hypothetical protein
MKIKSLITALMLMFVITVHAQQTQGVLDGKKFNIELKKDGVSDATMTLVFDKSMMDAPQYHSQGFSAATYQAKNASGLQSFRVVCKSDKEGTMTWQGTIKDDQIDGTVVWTKEGGDVVRYTFKGTTDKTNK